MKVIAIALIFLILPISVFAEDIPIVKPSSSTSKPSFIENLAGEKITINKNLFYGLIAGDVIAMIFIIVWIFRRFFDYV